MLADDCLYTDRYSDSKDATVPGHDESPYEISVLTNEASSPRRRSDGAHVSTSRSSRFKETFEGWFFRTREGLSVGPYPSRFDAAVSASLLTARLAQIEDQSDAIGLVMGFVCALDTTVRADDCPAPKDWKAPRTLEAPVRTQAMESGLQRLLARWF